MESIKSVLSIHNGFWLLRLCEVAISFQSSAFNALRLSSKKRRPVARREDDYIARAVAIIQQYCLTHRVWASKRRHTKPNLNYILFINELISDGPNSAAKNVSIERTKKKKMTTMWISNCTLYSKQCVEQCRIRNRRKWIAGFFTLVFASIYLLSR